MKKFLIAVFIFFSIFGVSLTGIYLHNSGRGQLKKVSLEDIVLALENKISMIVYYGQEECSACKVFEKNLQYISKQKDIMYLDANSLSREDKEILSEYHVTTTPTLIIINDGKISFYRNITTQEEIEKAITKVSIIEERFDGLDTIDYSELEMKIEEGLDFFLYIGREDCRDCIKFYPILVKCIEKKKGQGMYYLDIKKYKDLANKDDIEFYDTIKKKFDITWVPSVCHFRNGMIIAKYEFLNETYYELSKEQQKKEEKYYVEELYEWMEVEFK